MYKVLLVLLCIGHVLGDYYFQSKALAVKKKSSIGGLLLHCSLYTLAMLFVIMPVFSMTSLFVSLLLSLLHFLVDLIKNWIKAGQIKDSRQEAKIYFWDQLSHIFCIFFTVFLVKLCAVPFAYIPFLPTVMKGFSLDFLDLISWSLILLLIYKPSAISVRKALDVFPASERAQEKQSAGAWVGVLERGIVLLLLSVGQYAAIGFVLTAKSLARYKRISEDAQFAEYYLIGTLLSNLLVILFYIFIVGKQ